jgi:hypothetical protein
LEYLGITPISSDITLGDIWVDIWFVIYHLCDILLFDIRGLLHIVKDVVVIFHEVFSHDRSIHPWMASHKEKNHGKNEPPPPPLSTHVLLSRKGMLGPRGAPPRF